MTVSEANPGAAPSPAPVAAPARRRTGSPEEIARLLTAYVTTGHLQPGARIPSERRLAEELGVGRTVVREALKSLALVGLIESRHGDGTYVAAGAQGTRRRGQDRAGVGDAAGKGRNIADADAVGISRCAAIRVEA